MKPEMVTDLSYTRSYENGSDTGNGTAQPTAEQPANGGDDGRTITTSRWLAALRTIVGLDSPTLRDTIEDALKTEDENAFSREEREMLLRLLRYGALRVEDVMVPRADIIAVDESESIAQVLQTIVEAGVSRVPLFHETLDDPRGMVHVKDLVGWLTKSAAGPSGEERQPGSKAQPAAPEEPAEGVRKLFPELDFSRIDLSQPIASAKVRRSVLFVPPSMPAMNLLLRMQSTRKHMALVVDEYGGTDGLITIEDLVEQIVGDIEDEHDEDEELMIVRDPRLGLVAAARTPIEELEAHLGLSLSLDDDDIDTLGGLVFSLAGSIPVRGEIVRHPAGVEFEILDADPRRIKRLRIVRQQRPDAIGEHVASEAAPAAGRTDPPSAGRGA